MFVEPPREFESHYSAEECRKKLQEAAVDWELADDSPGSLTVSLYRTGGQLYLLGARVNFHPPLGVWRHYTWCKINLKPAGRGTKVSAVFTNRQPATSIFLIIGIALLAGTWQFRSRGGIVACGLTLGLVLMFISKHLGRSQRDEDKQAVVDLLQATLG